MGPCSVPNLVSIRTDFNATKILAQEYLSLENIYENTDWLSFGLDGCGPFY